MPWYKTGTVKTTINTNAIVGTGTSFIANARVGDAFKGPDGAWYEVTNIASDTAMSIAPNYAGPTVAAGTYAITPVQGYVKDLADQAKAMILAWGTTLAGLGAVSSENVVPVAKGGTGGTTQATARTGLGLGTVAVENVLPVAKGGTGTTTGPVVMVGSTAAADGVAGIVPKPLKTDTDKFLTGGGVYKTVDLAPINANIATVDGKVTALTTRVGTAETSLSTLNNTVYNEILFTYIYPNGGSAATPANVAVGNRFVTANPFPGKPVIVQVQILLNGIWQDPGWSSNNNTAYGVTAGMAGDDIVVQAGASGVAGQSVVAGGSGGLTAVFTTAPVRVMVWRLKG